MFRQLELLFLDFVVQYLGSVDLTVILAVIGLGFVAIQFVRTNVNFIPLVLGVTGLILALTNHVNGYKLGNILSLYIENITTPQHSVNPAPVIEPVLEYLIGPASTRTLTEEIFLIGIFSYVCLVIFTAFKAFRKTKKIFDPANFNFKKLLFPKNARPKRSKTNELGSGDLASAEQILNWTKPKGKGDTALEVTELKGSEGIALKAGNLIWGKEQRNRHILIVAKTGSGKTTKLIIPMLYNDCMCKERSTIIIDSKPEMWVKLAAMTNKYNPDKKIMLFNALDPKRSMSWNILSKIKDSTDCKLISNTIIMATDVPGAKSDSPFFRNNALAILNAIMVGLLYDQGTVDYEGKPKESTDVLSMPRVHALIQSGMKPLASWLEAHRDSRRTTQTFIELARSGSQNADTIMSELSMRVAAWDLPSIRLTTANNELDLEDLVKHPSLFIVEFNESNIEMLRPLANVIVVEILRFLVKYAESCPHVTLPRPVSLVIDEFASALGKVPDIEVKLNTLRSRNVSIVAAIQSTAQIKAIYDTFGDTVLAGFSTKIFMPALDLVDSEWASKESGQMTIRFKTSSVNSSKRIVDMWSSKSDGTSEQVQQRAVLTPDEIGKPTDNINTFFMPNTPVFQGYLKPYYENPVMLARINEFDSEDKALKIREKPIEFDDQSVVSNSGATSSPAPSYNGLPPGISNTAGWSDDQIVKKLDECRKVLEWENTTGSAKKWWEAFETENNHRKALILRLAEELVNRKATITEFFLAYVYSNTENIQANLHYLDYTRLKKEEEKRKKEAQAAEKNGGGMAAAA